MSLGNPVVIYRLNLLYFGQIKMVGTRHYNSGIVEQLCIITAIPSTKLRYLFLGGHGVGKFKRTIQTNSFLVRQQQFLLLHSEMNHVGCCSCCFCLASFFFCCESDIQSLIKRNLFVIYSMQQMYLRSFFMLFKKHEVNPKDFYAKKQDIYPHPYLNNFDHGFH